MFLPDVTDSVSDCCDCGVCSFSGFVALLMSEAHSAAAEASPALTCSATRLPDGAVTYQLSQPPSSPQCETCWEDQNVSPTPSAPHGFINKDI